MFGTQKNKNSYFTFTVVFLVLREPKTAVLELWVETGTEKFQALLWGQEILNREERSWWMDGSFVFEQEGAPSSSPDGKPFKGNH